MVLEMAGGRVTGLDQTLEQLFQERYSVLVGLARLLLDERELAEEVVMEAFARTLEGWSRVRETGDPYPYVRGAVVNLSRSGLRRRSVVRRHRAEVVQYAPAADVAVVTSESRREVIEALRALPRRQRECVVLRYFEDASTAETAEALGISEGAVKTHLHRALGSMEKRLEGSR